MNRTVGRFVVYSVDTGNDRLHSVNAILRAEGLDVRPLSDRPPPAPPAAEKVVLLMTLGEHGRMTPPLAQWTISHPLLWFTSDYRPDTAAELALSGQVLLPLKAPADLLLRALYCVVSRQDGADFLGQSYRLSPQETRLVRCMMRGLSTEESAEMIGCKVQTIPSYWNRIFRKAGVRTQRDLLLLYIRALHSRLTPSEYPGAAQ